MSSNEITNDEMISVEVCYALPQKQTLLNLRVAKNAQIEDIIKESGILEIHSEIDLSKDRVGIFSKFAKLTDSLNDKDRIEIYRPLIADPKEVRKQRALKSKKDQ